jgi:hypothetical protein
MAIVEIVLILSAGLPLGWAWWANRHTALVHALFWAILSWLAWLGSATMLTMPSRYLALSLTACAGVAVLGARRPGAAAWNFVVTGLLAVLLLPLGRGLLANGDVSIGPISLGFLAVVLIVGMGNYFPTRLGPGALALLVACLMELRYLDREKELLAYRWPGGLAATSVWLAAAAMFGWKSKRAFPVDQLWCDFRDRFGAVWALLLREQFNLSARNGGLAVELRWSGLRSHAADAPSAAEQDTSLEILVALLQRFGLP